ncbi:Cytochrome P450 3A12 [Leucoagaricus sp. SymC.cos]|nr:Cytochrome P450 3A12 [Leucoagaricus sp. SymC.cos]
MFLSPDACERVLVKEWTKYPRPDFMRKSLGMFTGYGLLTVEKNEHRQMRRMMNPAFSLPNLISQIEKYHEAIDKLLKVLNRQIASVQPPEDGIILPVYEWMSKVTLDIICTTAFGYDTNSLHDPHNELAFAYEKLIALQSGPNSAMLGAVVSIPGFMQFWESRLSWRLRKLIGITPGISPLGTAIESMNTIKGISKEILKEKMRESHAVEMEQERKKDIMSLLVRARKESLENELTGYTLSDAAMVDQVLTFLGAGHETTASGLTWTLYLLAVNKGAQDKLREEVAPVLAANPRPEYRSLKELQWLDCVVMESLRVLPPVPMTFRKAAKDDHIDGVFVPAGTILYVPIRVINTWQAIWGPDAEEFHPERWLDLPKSYNSQYSLLSFIVGPHACIGKTMAIIEMKTVLASLIANFEFDLAYEGQIPIPTAMITMKPKDNMPLRIRRVQHKMPDNTR